MEYTVTFLDSCGKERVIAEIYADSQEVAMKEAFQSIGGFLAEHSFVSYYKRVTEISRFGFERVMWVDVGSHTEFFHIYPVAAKSVKQAIAASHIEPAYY